MITLEKLEEKQTELGALIEKFKEQEAAKPSYPMTLNRPTLAEGEKFVGFIVSACGTKKHAIILLPGEKKDVNWQQAKDWAKSIGGELPDRVESALLFNILKSEFSQNWYWTREAYGSSDAWVQDFDDGSQFGWGIYGGCRARAVRRLSIY
jgi:hypothetical protein